MVMPAGLVVSGDDDEGLVRMLGGEVDGHLHGVERAMVSMMLVLASLAWQLQSILPPQS